MRLTKKQPGIEHNCTKQKMGNREMSFSVVLELNPKVPRVLQGVSVKPAADEWGLNEQKGTNSVDSGVGEKPAGVCNARARGTATFAATASIVNRITVLLHSCLVPGACCLNTNLQRPSSQCTAARLLEHRNRESLQTEKRTNSTLLTVQAFLQKSHQALSDIERRDGLGRISATSTSAEEARIGHLIEFF